MLEVAIRRKAKSLCLLALGIELNQVVRQLLDPGLGFLFQALPCGGTQFVEHGGASLFAIEFGNLVQAMNTDIQDVRIFVDQFDGLLHFPLDINFLEPPKLAYAVVNVGHKVAHLKGVEFFERDGLGLVQSISEAESLVTLKNFVIRIHHARPRGIFPALVQGNI